MAYQISIEAQKDIENTWLYTFENWSVEQADRYLQLILDEIEYLANNPGAGRDYSHVRKNYRSSRVKSHIIFYKVERANPDIEIIKVLHQGMDLETRLTD